MTLLKVGLIGCGRISDTYLRNCAVFDGLEITACASVDIEESRTKAAQHGVRFIRATIVSHNEGSIRVDFCRRAMTWHFPGTKSVHFQENQALPIT